MNSRTASLIVSVFFLLAGSGRTPAEYRDIPTDPLPGDALLATYFEDQVTSIENQCLAGIETGDDWIRGRAEARERFLEMLGLSPLPERTPLEAVVTGREQAGDVVVEKILFQSSPGLYVTGNFYRPADLVEPLPTILYVCGHGPAKEGDISYGNKATYQHHGAWFARNGYTCLIIDTLQLGEIEGIHHGTYRHNRWWWQSAGYTPAGVEAWNGIRALDYLATRPEVDTTRIGVTGRSGGGATTWWIAALDERVKVAVPVAGITSLRNHVVDGCIEGHCDCMFHVNRYRWDFPAVAALVAPRPLLIANTDKDRIFPLDGVYDVYTQTRRIYRLLDGEDHIGLALYEGPHKDTQPLRTAAFHWFERFLKDRTLTDEMPDTSAPKPFALEQLRVLETTPPDELNTTIDAVLTDRRPAPETADDTTLRTLREQSFGGWPDSAPDPDLESVGSWQADNLRLTRYQFTSQEPWRLPLLVLHRADLPPAAIRRLTLQVLDEPGWQSLRASLGVPFPDAFPPVVSPPEPDGLSPAPLPSLGKDAAIAWLAPRGIGPTRWTPDERERIHILRRFALLGQTLDGMRVWDIRSAVHTLRHITNAEENAPPAVSVAATGPMAANALYAALFVEPDLAGLTLTDLPDSLRTGDAAYLQALHILDFPQALAIAESRLTVTRSHAQSADPR